MYVIKRRRSVDVAREVQHIVVISYYLIDVVSCESIYGVMGWLWIVGSIKL